MSKMYFNYKNLLVLTGTMFLFALASIKPLSAEGVSPPDGSQAFYTAGTVNFRPIEFKIDKASEVTSIEWTNRPDNINDLLYSFKTKDGVIYRLEGFPAYNGIMKAGLTTVDLLITVSNGSSLNLVIPVVIANDEAPLATITSTGPLNYNKGHHAQVGVQLNDVGRNITEVRALLYAPGNTQNPVATIGQRRWDKYIDNIQYIDFRYWDWYEHTVYEAQSKANSDLIDYRLPVYINQNVATGSYDLRIEVVDGKDNLMLSDPITVNITAPASAPRLTITAPDYRIPAGESYSVKFDTEHLDRLDRIEFLQSGPVGTDVTKSILFVDGQYTQTGQVLLPIPADATEGQTFTVTATVYDINGSAKSISADVNVGLWGERTLVAPHGTVLDERFQFANVTIPYEEAVTHNNPNIKFNSITIEQYGSFDVYTESLYVHGELLINGGGVRSAIYNHAYQYRSEYKVTGGQHGGDSSTTGYAYGDFRNPKYPGSNYGTYQYTGGNLTITAGSINMNHQYSDITVRSNYNANSGGGVITLNSPVINLQGALIATGNRHSGGGSVLINTNTLTSSGVTYIHATGGPNANSAGGRIAVYYDTFNGEVISPIDTINFYVHPHRDDYFNPVPNSYGGAGTVFLKRPDQSYGDLHIDNGGKFYTAGNQNFTTLETLGKHILSNVEPVAGTTEHYKVTVEGKPWQIKNKYGWDAGVIGKHISLNSADKAAPVYEVVDEVVAVDGIDVVHSGELTVAGSLGSVALIPLTLSQDDELYFDLSFYGNLGGKVFIFRDADSDGVVTTADLVTGGEFDAPSQDYNPFKKIALTAGDYIIGVSRRYVSAGEAVLGQSNSNQLCNNCSYSLSIKSVNTNALIIQSAVPPVFTSGNEVIGVVRLNHLAVSPGSRLRGADRLHIDSFEILEETAIENLADIVSTASQVFTDLTLASQSAFYIGDVTADSVTLNDGVDLIVYGALNIANNLTIQSTTDTGYGYGEMVVLPSTLVAKNVNVGGDILVKDTNLEVRTDNPIAANNFSLLSNSTMTVPQADINKQKLYTIGIDAATKITVDTTSSIDLRGKGYPTGYGLDFAFHNTYRFVGHGGQPRAYSNEGYRFGPYGDYANAQYAGIGSVYNRGGGFIKLNANELSLDGSILADGNNGATGGGVNITTNLFNGRGRISSIGGQNLYNNTASGGRISIVAAVDTFTNITNHKSLVSLSGGKYQISSGPQSSAPSYDYTSASGTAYIASAVGQPGHLIVDNIFANISQISTSTTPLRSVGRQTITNIEALPGNQYRVTVAGTPWQERVSNPDGLGLVGLKVDLNANDEAGELLEIIDGTENTIIVTSATDISAAIGQQLIGVITLDKISVLSGAILEINDRLVLNNPTGSTIDSDAKLIVAQMNEAGLQQLILNPNVAGVIDITELYQAANLSIAAATVNFLGGLELTGDLTLSSTAKLDVDTLNINNLDMNGGDLKANSISMVSGSVLNAKIEAQSITASNNLSILSFSTVTAPLEDANQHYSLDINVQGTLSIDGDSVIDMNGKGYYYSVINRGFGNYDNWENYYSYDLSARGCHGGESASAHNRYVGWDLWFYPRQNCTIGHYKQASFAGLSNVDFESGYDALGGGFVKINAGTFFLDGKILANGTMEYYHWDGAAGGGVHIAASVFDGAGIVQAQGTPWTSSAYNYAGPGGRISVYVNTTNTFSGSLDAGPGDPGPEVYAGAAGTVYVKNPGSVNGGLTVDNFDRQYATPPDSDQYKEFGQTTIRTVGKHKAKAITNLGNNQWRIATQTSSVAVKDSNTLPITGVGSIKVYRFSLTEPRQLYFDMSDARFNAELYLFRDDGDLTNDDYVYDFWHNGNEVNSRNYYSLPAGDYLISIGGDRGNHWIDEINALTNGANNTDGGDYKFKLATTNRSWTDTEERSLAERYITFEVAGAVINQYKIIDNSEDAIIVESVDDLSAKLNTEFIGVHTLDSLVLRNNSYLNFEGDRLIIQDMAASEISATSTLEVGQLDQATFDNMLSGTAGKLIITEDVWLDHLTVSNREIEFRGALHVANNLELNTNANVIAKTINASDIVIDSSLLSVRDITVSNNVTVRNTSTIVTDGYFWKENRYLALNINVAGILDIDADSKVDVSGKGEIYRKPQFAFRNYQTAMDGGIGVDYNGNGGGALNIFAGSINLNGQLISNGGQGSSYGTLYGAEGGSISINTGIFAGGGISSAITANGSVNRRGGRIRINVSQANSYDGLLSAAGENNNSTTGGAGTIFITDPTYPEGYLVTDNATLNAPLASTNLAAIGKHVITRAERISPTEVRVFINDNTPIRIDTTGYISSEDEGAVHHYEFTVTYETTIRINLQSNDLILGSYYLFRKDGNSLVRVNRGNNWMVDGGLLIYQNLVPGDYLLAIGGDELYENAARYKYHVYSPYPGTFSLKVDSLTGSPWNTSNSAEGWGVAGYSVDLDASDGVDTPQKIISSDVGSLVVEDSSLTAADIARINDTAQPRIELVGLHQLDRLAVKNGAAVTFGQDRVVINSPQAGDFAGMAQFKALSLTDSNLQFILSDMDTGRLEIDSDVNFVDANLTAGVFKVTGNANVANSLTLSGTANFQVSGDLNVAGDLSAASEASISAPSIHAANILLDGASMTTSNLTVDTNLTLLETGTGNTLITTLDATVYPFSVYPLNITVGNNITIDTNSVIDVSGKGYPANVPYPQRGAYVHAGGPDFNFKHSTSCHAGVASTAIAGMDCITYGRLEDAQFAGSAGQRLSSPALSGNGGGVIKITANSLSNQGNILANGERGYHGGAGGSINITVNSLIGSGTFAANGSGSYYSNTAAGGGGRISINLPDSFANNINTDAGTSQLHAKGSLNGVYQHAGAGTIYIKYDNEQHGHLIVDNEGLNGPANGTPIRQVGRQAVAAVYDAPSTGDARYELSLGTNSAVHQRISDLVTTTGVGSIKKYPFTLTTAKTVNIEIVEGLYNYRLFLLQDNGNNQYTLLTQYTAGNNVVLPRIANFALQPGNYIVAVTGDGGNIATLAELQNGIYTSTNRYSGDYVITIDTVDDTWKASGGIYGWGLDGLYLSTTPDITPLNWEDAYPIVANTEESVVVESPTLDLKSPLPPELVGVHVFETINIRGNAQVDFGDDILFVKDLPNSVIEAGSVVTSSPNSVRP